MRALFGGLARAGCKVFDMGLATTPAGFVSTMLAPFRYDASVTYAEHLRNIKEERVSHPDQYESPLQRLQGKLAGAYVVVVIMIEMVRMKLAGSEEGGIGSLIGKLGDPVESVELRMNILTQPKDAKQKGVRKYIEVLTLYFFLW